MSTTSGGDTTKHMQENSVTTLYDGDRTVVNHRVSPPSSSNADSGLDNSNTESSAGDAKLIIDVPDFSREMETPRTGIDNPSFETDKTDVPKPLTNGHNGTVNQEKDKMAEAVNLELINMKPFAKSINGKENGVPTKKKETAVNMNDTYDDYFIPVNEHKKYMRGGEKLYVTKDKRDMNQSKKPFMCWVFGLVLLAAAVIVAILASTGIIFNNETAVESRNFMENEKIAGFGNHLGHFSSVSPPPGVESSSPFSPPTTDMSAVYLPRTVQGEIVIDNREFTPDLANKSSSEFQRYARSIETELKNVLFKNQPLSTVNDDIHIKVIELSPGSIVAKYRIGWEYKDDSEPQDLIDAVTLNTRLDSYLRESNGFLDDYRVPIHRLRSDPVMDKCKIDNGKCSHYCSYDYINLEFVCSCPSELTISENMKDCKRIIEEDSFDTMSEYDSFPKLEPSSVPETKSEAEPELKTEAEPSSKSEPSSEPELKSEPSSEPELKSEPEPSSVPEVEPEPKQSSGPEITAEFEPSPEPEVKAEPKPSSVSEVKSESESSLVSEVKSEPESSSETEVKAEPEPSSEPEVKAEPEPSSVLEVKSEPEPSSEPEVKSEPDPSSVPEIKSKPEPSSVLEVKSEPEPSLVPETKSEPEPSTIPEVKSEPEPSSVPEVKAEPEPSSEPEVKAQPEPSLVPEVKAEPEPSSVPEVKSEPEPTSVPEVKSEPEPSSEPEVKAEPEPNSVSSVKPESEVKANQPELSPEQEIKPESEFVTKIEPDTKPEPEPSAEPDSIPSFIETFESLSDVDISSDSDLSEQNNKPFSSSSTEKSILNMDQSDREAKSHSEEVFSHEIKPEVTYIVSTESEFETKTESPSKENSKPKESSELLGDVDLNNPEESTTIPSITENWLTTASSIIPGIPKLPSDLEVTEKENVPTEEEMKTESLGLEQMELKSENKTSIDLILDSHTESPFEKITEIPELSILDNVKDLTDIVTVSTIDTDSTTKEDINLSIKELENITTEHVTEFVDMTTMSSTINQEVIKPLHTSTDPNFSEKIHSDDLITLEKTSIPDPTKKLQSLTSLEDQITNSPNVDVLSTSTQSSFDNFNENSSPDEQDAIDQIITHSSESNFSDVVNENENDNMSALDLYQKPESKKKDKKTSKNPEFYFSDSGFTKRNKTKTEKENKKNNKSDTMDMMTELLNSNKCEEGQFQCTNGTTKDGSYCIKMSSRCDTNKDCTDNSDEYDCAENACSGNFQCKSGECLQRNLVCNNIMECEDGSDEQSCDLWKCANDEKQCTGGQCLPVSYFCDGKSDCNDHSDELQCNSTCDGYQCSNSYCISSTLRCNGVNDCTGGEDEQNCECNSNEFKCNTGSECIPKNQVCDNIAQCTDRSDEWQCVQLDGVQLFAKKESEISMKVCSDNWTDTWSNFVCQSLGFTETKTTNFRTNENSTENFVGYLKLKDNSTLNSSKSLTGYLEPASTSCETVEIKCSSKHLCGDFGGKDPLSMEMWPSVVYLHNAKTHKSCTSSLVKRNWILSSYSCVHSIDESLSPDQWEAISSKSRVANEQNLTRRSVSRIISHPGVKFEKFRYFNDSVLVELSLPYDLSDEVNTICLPEQVVDNKQPCVTASWSYESPGVFKQFSRYLSEPLMQTDLCNSTKHFNGFLTEQEICVTSREMEASNMEIGSPLMCLAENGLWQLQGMLSYRGGYGRSSKPSLYNAIVESVPWVENTIAFGV